MKLHNSADQALNPWHDRHKLLIMVSGAIILSLILVMISIGLYNSSGAAQLDLSRPGYSSIREQAGSSNKFEAFPSSGDITPETVENFKAIYKEHADEAMVVDAFSGNVLGDEQLGIDPPAF